MCLHGQMGFSTSNDPQHDMYLALEQWVEKGAAPSTVIATKQAGEGATAAVKMTRPLCAYPRSRNTKAAVTRMMLRILFAERRDRKYECVRRLRI